MQSGGAMVPRRVIASAESEAEAQATVDYLWSYGLRDSLSIAGADLRLADKPSRAGTVARRTAIDAGQGAALGFVMALLIALLAQTTTNGLLVVLWGLLYGVLLGALRGLFRGLLRTRPDVVTREVVATRFEVWCAPGDESVARRLLATRAEDTAVPGDEPSLREAA